MGKEGGEGSSGLYRSGSFYGSGGKEVLVVTQLEVALSFLRLANSKHTCSHRHLLDVPSHHRACHELQATAARTLLPCMDEPAYKATFDVSVEVCGSLDTCINVTSTTLISALTVPKSGTVAAEYEIVTVRRLWHGRSRAWACAWCTLTNFRAFTGSQGRVSAGQHAGDVRARPRRRPAADRLPDDPAHVYLPPGGGRWAHGRREWSGT